MLHTSIARHTIHLRTNKAKPIDVTPKMAQIVCGSASMSHVTVAYQVNLLQIFRTEGRFNLFYLHTAMYVTLQLH